MLAVLLGQGCSHLGMLQHAYSEQALPARDFHFADGGKGIYFVLDKRIESDRVPAETQFPETFLFVVAGSDCMSMRYVLPQYFQGLRGASGRIRIFILQKRFIEARTYGRVWGCGDAFIQADHPSRWIADQTEFIHAQLEMADANGQPPRRIVALGISEGSEIIPILAQRIARITHAAIIGNGGMDPDQAYRLLAQRHGFAQAPAAIEQACSGKSDSVAHIVAGRTCRYWSELRTNRHSENLLALRIPVFMAMGEADALVPIESAWFARDQFAFHGKSNLRLLTFPGADHGFQRGNISLMPFLWDGFDNWLSE